MHLTLLFVLLLLDCSLVQSRSVRTFMKGNPEAGWYKDGGTDIRNLSVSAVIERANKNLEKTNDGSPIKFGDIVVEDGLQNSDQCLSRNPGCKWPKNADGNVYVPYIISNQYYPNEKRLIEDVLKTFDRVTCIRFKPRSNEEGYIHVMPHTGCFSYVGRIGREQILSLGRNHYSSCLHKHVIQHEFLHALGFHHEHNRSDRDYHVRIAYENIQQGAGSQFQKKPTNNLGTPYDYASIMHYERNAFSRNGQPTIIPIPNSNVAVGRSTEMNANDILRVNKVYCGRV